MPVQSPIMTVMIRAAEKAGRSLLRDFNEIENLQVSRKGPGDFVTAADKRSEKIIFEELQKARPDYSFMMEESGEVKGNDPDHVWIIDPLDGTHNFMHGVPHWSISIALEQKGQIVSGLIYDCAKDEMFTAEKGGGAWLRNRRLRASGRNVLEQCMINYGQPVNNSEARDLFYKELRVVQGHAMVRRFASAALDLAYVAAGRIDGYWERGIKPWDVAAGVILVKEAGGAVSSIENDDNPVYSGNLVSGNQQVHSDIRKLLKTV
ncbi:MAG: inositol monophosphatase [Micavibrio aeruginosavorus]|uniref:Inositol-1-monophosphatase n=1 Tax=Micavibrio aeruginosavorus TaxID=349221 RepID=A0A2W4ZZ00_9BACT|nr:MAG: inositol monophosphatase [Micavibrio aeruginosavorus]